MSGTLKQLQQKVALKKQLEAKLSELRNQRRKYDREVISLRGVTMAQLRHPADERNAESLSAIISR